MKKVKNIENNESLPSNNGRYSIKISEIISIRKKLNEINSVELSNIDFIDENNNVVKINSSIISDFKYTGLNNIDFIVSGFYKNSF